MDSNEFIIEEPETYLKTQNKTLEERLDKIKLNDQEFEIIKEQTGKIIVDKLLGTFKVGEVISTFLNWNDEVDEEIKKAKKSILLKRYFNMADNHEDAIYKLKNFLMYPQGNVLFNKILRILDENPPNLDLIEHLSSTLKYIVSDEKFYTLFEQHKFALSQIEKLTPQALTILSDFSNYPSFKLGMIVTEGNKVTSDWSPKFAKVYCKKKNIDSKELIKRISYVISDLETGGYIEAVKKHGNTCICKVSSIGQDILPYLCNDRTKNKK